MIGGLDLLFIVYAWIGLLIFGAGSSLAMNFYLLFSRRRQIPSKEQIGNIRVAVDYHRSVPSMVFAVGTLMKSIPKDYDYLDHSEFEPADATNPDSADAPPK